MSDVTHILSQIEQGDPQAAEKLLPLVYDELRKLAAAKLAREKPGQALQATALVHEAYVRLIDRPNDQNWDGRSHFFAAAAEAMRRIVIDRARAKGTQKRGGGGAHLELAVEVPDSSERSNQLLALDEALTLLEQHDPPAAGLVKLRYFVGMTHQEAAAALGITRRAADRLWSLAKAWLYQHVADD
jgi:RNA polymerase sigma factor (TIGR02999 family)